MTKKKTAAKKSSTATKTKRTPSKKKIAKVLPKLNRVMFAIDRSGSMQSIMNSAIKAFNDNLKTIKEQCAATGQDATVSLITFDDVIDTVFFNRDINSIQPIDEGSIHARNSTALFDAAESAINQLQTLPVGKDEDVSYLISVITDGEENASKPNSHASGDRLNALMRKVIATDLWTTTFLVPRGGRYTLERFGVPQGNIMEWDATEAGVKKYAAATSTGISNYFSARASGQSSVRSFYTDMTDVSLKEVRQLDDLSKKAQVLDVNHLDPKTHEAFQIRDFIEFKGLTFTKGCAFYQLVGGKDNADKVQDYKKVLIMEKGKTKVYGGDDARQLLGLPASVTKVRPGDHGSFDIFIQSTSVNRRLQPGTRLIYMPSAAL